MTLFVLMGTLSAASSSMVVLQLAQGGIGGGYCRLEKSASPSL